MLHTAGFRRDNRLNIVLRKVLQQGVGVIGLVAQNGISFKSLDQCLRMCHIAELSCAEQTAQRIAKRIDCHMDFGA